MKTRQTTRNLLHGALLLAVSWMTAAAPAFGAGAIGKRVALVIGNTHYGDGADVSGVENARAMGDALRQLDFQVLAPPPDVSQIDLRTDLDNLSQQIKDASLVVVFYSGHGFQDANSYQYLLTIDGKAVPISEVLYHLADAPTGAVKLVFLDACRVKDSIPQDQQGYREPSNLPRHTLVAFAASPGQVAVSGGAKDRSPYTMALLNSIREPGLTIETLMQRVHDEVARATGLQPRSFGFETIPGFLLRPPVFVQAAIGRADDDLMVLLNGEIVMDRTALSQGKRSLRLQAGDNRLLLLASNQHTFDHSQSWGRTEGWGYSMRLFGPGGTELKWPNCGKDPCFSDAEDVPFKDGPHHGKAFRVAEALLTVDPVTAVVTITSADTNIWHKEAPLYARDQDILYCVPATQLPLADALGLPPGTDLAQIAQEIPGLAATLFPALPPVKLPDLNKTWGVVRGNRDFRSYVEACVRDHLDTLTAQFKASLKSLLGGADKPFEDFDRVLGDCVWREVPQGGSTPLKADDIKVWTSLEDLSDLPTLPPCKLKGGGQ